MNGGINAPWDYNWDDNKDDDWEAPVPGQDDSYDDKSFNSEDDSW